MILSIADPEQVVFYFLLVRLYTQQVTVALSSTEAEYQAFTIAVQQILYYRQILAELGYCQDQPTVLFGDNKGALSLAVTYTVETY
jgi:hypothetical protein